MPRLLLLLAVLGCSGPAANPGPVSAQVDAPQALLIGGSTHPQGTVAGVEADLDAMETLLGTGLGYTVHRVQGPAATLQTVTDAMDQLVRTASPDHPVVLYLSGAGQRIEDLDRDEPDPWDEALLLADHPLLDDALHPWLERLDAAASEVTLVLDVGLAGPGDRYAGTLHVGESGASDAGGEPGDGVARWPQTKGVAVLEAAQRGPAMADTQGGRFTQQLAVLAPFAATLGELETMVYARLAGGAQVPAVTAERQRAPFGIERDVPELAAALTVPAAPLPVQIASEHWDSEWATRMRALAELTDHAPWLEIVQGDAPRQFSVRPDPHAPDQQVLVIGASGAIRNIATERGVMAAPDHAVRMLRNHAAQRAVMQAGPTSDPTVPWKVGPLSVRMVSAPTQKACSSPQRWREPPQGGLQVVPGCHAWELEVTLDRGARGPMAVGGLVLANDGTVLGFPFDGSTAVLQRGETRRFFTDGASPASEPPFGIPEHVVTFAGPSTTAVPWADLRKDPAALVGPYPGPWFRHHLTYVVEANAEDDSRDPTPTRELTLANFDARYLQPQNTNTFLYKLLENMMTLARYHGDDGPKYAQCLPVGHARINGSTRRAASEWPGGDCWTAPWNFTRDNMELKKGIDCSMTVWWALTRTCLGDTRQALPGRKANEDDAGYEQRLRTFHTEQRRCLLFTDETYKGGYLSTAVTTADQADYEAVMRVHFEPCDGGHRTGDLLVTRNKTNTDGHTVLVVDPERGVVFGSHGSDLNLEPGDLTAEELEKLDRFEAWWSHPESDKGVEFQFVRPVGKPGEEPFAGFDSQRTTRCWRHKALAQEWETDESARAGSAVRDDYCEPSSCGRIALGE